jgi:hypothetical protein
MRFNFLLVVAVMGIFWLGTARAAENSQACAQSYEKAQEERTAGKLRSAIQHLTACIAPECPAFIREDCMRWINQTESALPSVVFSVRADGNDLTDVEIRCDDSPITGKLDGKSLPVDPGLHDFSFSVPGRAPIARQILVLEGEQNRIIDVEFDSPRASVALPAMSLGEAKPDLQDAPEPRARRLVPYVFAGVGVLGLAGFTVFAILGNNQAGDLERTCSPTCRPEQVDSVKTKYHLADASLGVGIVSAGVATYLWLTSHGKDTAGNVPSTAINFFPRSAGGVLQVSTAY